MKIEKAIEILDTHSKASYSFHSPDFWDAIKLGIEALKALKRNRAGALPWTEELLPGEDK